LTTAPKHGRNLSARAGNVTAAARPGIGRNLDYLTLKRNSGVAMNALFGQVKRVYKIGEMIVRPGRIPHPGAADEVAYFPLNELPPGSTFVRNSTAFDPYNGLEVAANIPRFAQIHNGGAFISEPASSNYCKYSNDLTNAVWAKNNVAFNTAIPDAYGNTTFSYMEDTSTNSNTSVVQLNVFLINSDNRLTLELKPLGKRYVYISSGTGRIFLDLQTGEQTYTDPAGDFVLLRSEPLNNGWWRFVISGGKIHNSQNMSITSSILPTAASPGSPGRGIGIARVQIEQTGKATTYIDNPTSGIGARANELCNVPFAGIIPDMTSFTIMLWAIYYKGLPNNDGFFFDITDGTNNNRVASQQFTGSIYSPTGANSGTVASSVLSNDNNMHHYCITYDSVHEMQLYLDGAPVGNTNITVFPDACTTPLRLAYNRVGTGQLICPINHMRVFKRRLLPEEIQYYAEYGQ
jgi:hypothetical protein